MGIRKDCPGCGKYFDLHPVFAGEAFDCDSCGHRFIVQPETENCPAVDCTNDPAAENRPTEKLDTGESSRKVLKLGKKSSREIVTRSRNAGTAKPDARAKSGILGASL